MKTDAVELWHTAKLRPVQLLRYRLWKRGHLDALRRDPGLDRDERIRADAVHLTAAADWLARAQDASPQGGIVGRYLLRQGWTSAYPETTGYIVPTFIALGTQLDAGFIDRARRAIAFLLTTQLPDGAFPAGEISMQPPRPSPFNTAQIMTGLLAWHRHSGDQDCLEAALRAGRWLIAAQDADGAWRQGFYHDVPACYSAHLACFVAELGVFCNDAALKACASANLDWILGHYQPDNGWIECTGFTASEQALRVADLHTIGYTLAGVQQMGTLLARDDALAAVACAARGVGAALDRLGWLPGVLDHAWRAKADSACLTGNVQMALVWMALYRDSGADEWRSWAERAIELTKASQLLNSPNPGLRGGIPGTTPMWGWYNDGAVLSWSAKFFIDALLCKAALVAHE